MTGRHSGDSADHGLDAASDAGGDGWELDRAELIPRPAPDGMSRKDRRLWRVLEAERIAAAVNRARPDEGYRAIKPGKIARRTRFGLGVRGRRTFREADFAYRAQRWESQQARADMDLKARGVLVLTVLLLAFLVWRLVPWGGGDDTSTGPVSTTARSSAAATTAVATSGSASSATSTATSSEAASASSSAEPTSTSESAVFGNGTNTVPTAAPSTGGAPGVISSSSLRSTPAVPAPPTGPVPASALRTTVSAGQAWFERTCGSSWREPFGAAVTATRAAMTARGWAYADPATDAAGQRWWSSVVQGKETRRCTGLTVEKFTGPGPSGPSVATLIFQADRIVTSEFPDVPARLEKVSELRTVTRGADGLWRVGAPEVGG